MLIYQNNCRWHPAQCWKFLFVKFWSMPPVSWRMRFDLCNLYWRRGGPEVLSLILLLFFCPSGQIFCKTLIADPIVRVLFFRFPFWPLFGYLDERPCWVSFRSFLDWLCINSPVGWVFCSINLKINLTWRMKIF